MSEIRSIRARNITVAVLLLALVFLSSLIYSTDHDGGLFSKSSDDRSHVVVLTEDGFEPDTLNIDLGDTVLFRSEAGGQFWPASNLHPTHSIYSEFDPKRPLESSETWQFTFEREGVFEFHDHLKPNMTGVITVGDDTSFLCDQGERANKEQCWEKAITSILHKNGLAAAFNKIVDLYDEDVDFAPICHSYVHLIGEEAYKEFSKSGTLPRLPREVSYCGYGFFHGYMETLLFTSGDLNEARELCKEVDRQFKGEGVSGPSTACYHGYGHGFTDGGDPSLWGDAQKMIAPSISLCESIVESSLESYLCVTGVYNAIERLSVESKYGLDELKTDPIGFCNRQKSEYRGACYTNMIPAVLRITENDVSSAIAYAKKHMTDPEGLTVNNYTNKNEYILSVMAEFIRLHLSDPTYRETGLTICRTLPQKEQFACVEGLSFGHMKYGKPGMMTEQFLSFCADDMLTDAEEDSCYGGILSKLSIWYNGEESVEICSRVPVEISKRYCTL